MSKVVIYGRVSTTEQTIDNQIVFLKRILEQNQWNLIDIH